MRRTALRGHALRSEGKAYGRDGSPDGPLVRYRGHIGQGLCECGATSDVLWSDAARKRWHAQHKDAIRREHPGPAAANLNLGQVNPGSEPAAQAAAASLAGGDGMKGNPGPLIELVHDSHETFGGCICPHDSGKHGYDGCALCDCNGCWTPDYSIDYEPGVPVLVETARCRDDAAPPVLRDMQGGK